jgi:hypothetical protein
MMPATVAMGRAKVKLVFLTRSAQQMSTVTTTHVVALGVADAGVGAGIAIIGVLVLTNAP